MNELNDFLKIVSQGKETSSTSQKLKQVKENAKNDLSSLFAQLSEVKKTDDHLELITEESLVQSSTALSVDITPLQTRIEEVEKYIASLPKDSQSFQQPQPDAILPDLRNITNKLKFLEQAIGKIAATGPGSGEVNFRWLDDVDRSTIDTPESNQEHVLRYNSSTKKFFFGELTGDHREINSFTFDINGPRIEQTPRMMYWNQNEDCLNITHQDGTTLQAGLENYIQVHNSTSNTLTNGTVVRFSGSYSNGDFVPEVVPHISDGTVPPLYTVGVVTNDILIGTTGRCTILGKVRDVNTTGSDVSEIWNNGDILYVHPTLPGKLTKNKPTAPQVVVSIAAVLKKDPTTGILLVRPTIFPRLYYGSFSDKTDQYQTQINTPAAITFDTTDIANGHHRGTDTSHIIAENSGLYNYRFSIQLVSNSSNAKEVWIWFRKNGIDIPNSATRKTITGSNVYDVAAWDISLSMLPNDYFQIMWAVSNTGVHIDAPSSTQFCPAIPSVILNVSEIAL